MAMNDDDFEPEDELIEPGRDDDEEDEDDEEEDPEEEDGEDSLDRVHAVVDEIESHAKRLEAIDPVTASAEQSFRELAETTMSLLVDLGMAVADTLSDLREDLDELNTALDTVTLDAPEDETAPTNGSTEASTVAGAETAPDYSHLSSGDANQILEQLYMFRQAIELGVNATDDEDARSEALDRLAKIEATIARVSALAVPPTPQA